VCESIPLIMAEDTEKKKGFLKRAASGASKVAGKAANDAKNQAKGMATDYVAKQAEKALKEKLDIFKNKK
jgi:hypothetical protein